MWNLEEIGLREEREEVRRARGLGLGLVFGGRIGGGGYIIRVWTSEISISCYGLDESLIIPKYMYLLK